MSTSIWGQTHLNVGWFDDVDSTLDLAACERLGVQVIRRPMFGGGTAFYDAGCAVMCAFVQKVEDAPDLDKMLAGFQPIYLDMLDRLGLGEVRFEGSSDLRWRGRKIGALTGQPAGPTNSVGSFLNLKPPNLDLYLQVVRVPDDKFKDKAVKDMREYVVTAQEIAGREVTYEDYRDALLAACRAAGMDIAPEPFTDEERARFTKMAEKIADPAFIRRVSWERFTASAPAGARIGFGNEKGRKLCRAGVAVDDGGVIIAAMMAGDMHVGPPDTMDRIAAALVGADSADRAGLRRRIAEVFEGPDVHQPEALMGVTTDDLLAAVEKAVASAR
jgi:lipoate-protein ligase A